MVQHGGISPFKNRFKKSFESKKTNSNSRLRSKTAYGKLRGAPIYIPTSVGVIAGPSGIPAEKHSLKMIIYGILDEKAQEINDSKNYFTKSMGLTEGIAIETVKNNIDFRDYAEQQPRIRSNIVRPNSTTPFEDLFGMDEDSFIKETYKEYKRNSQGGKKKLTKKTKKRTMKKKRIMKKTKRRNMKKGKKRSTRKH